MNELESSKRVSRCGLEARPVIYISAQAGEAPAPSAREAAEGKGDAQDVIHEKKREIDLGRWVANHELNLFLYPVAKLI